MTTLLDPVVRSRRAVLAATLGAAGAAIAGALTRPGRAEATQG